MGTMTFGSMADEATQPRDASTWPSTPGVDFIDTAEVYPVPPDPKWAGRSEEICGKWLAGRPRDAVIVATKVAGPGGRLVPGAGPRRARRALDRHHIERAGRGEPAAPAARTTSTSTRRTGPTRTSRSRRRSRRSTALVEAGKVRYVGCSNESAYGLTKSLWMADRHGTARYETIQNNFSLLNRRFEDELATVCRREQVSLLRLQPDRRRRALGQVPGRRLAGGRALQPVRRTTARGTGDDPPLREREDAGDRPRASPRWRRECGLSPVTFAIAWTLTHDFVGSTHHRRHARSSSSTSCSRRPTRRLPPDALAAVERISREIRYPMG